MRLGLKVELIVVRVQVGVTLYKESENERKFNRGPQELVKVHFTRMCVFVFVPLN